MSVATYPGTVTPLLGLESFSESERDVFFGRDQERDQLAQLVTTPDYRAGLLYGEPGVGKTSLLRAGVQPDLRDHGIVALYCNDNNQPLASLSTALVQASGQSPVAGENPATFVTRVINKGTQMFLLIFDDIDLAMDRDEQVTREVADLFMSVASRSAGRARFLFSCASTRVHSFSALEMRTGSLFPPANRFELCRMKMSDATTVLERILALTALPFDNALPSALIEDLAANTNGLVLPGELQIAVLALKEQQIETITQYQQACGYKELVSRWIIQSARATGNERSAMRVLAEFAIREQSQDSITQVANVTPAFAIEAIQTLHARGFVKPVSSPQNAETCYALTNDFLAPIIRDETTVATFAAKKSRKSLQKSATTKKHLSRQEYVELRREGVVPSTPQEQAIVNRTVRLGKLVVFSLFALPIVSLILIYSAMSGAYYLDTAQGMEGVKTIVTRAGNANLSWFDWLPSTPHFGSIIADSGLTRTMVTEDMWRSASNNDITGELSDESYAENSENARLAPMAALMLYAQLGDDSELHTLHHADMSTHLFAERLHLLAAIAQGAPEEVTLVEAAMQASTTAVFKEALGVAVAAETRYSGSYKSNLASALVHKAAPHRRLARSAMATLDIALASPIIQTALSSNPKGYLRHELQAFAKQITDRDLLPPTTRANPSLQNHISLSPIPTRPPTLRRAFQKDASAATTAALALISENTTSKNERLLAIDLLAESAPIEAFDEIEPVVNQLRQSKDVTLRAAILPLYARIQPAKAANAITVIGNQADISTKLQVAIAKSWGHIARTKPALQQRARIALQLLLKSKQRPVRAGAARAYGYLGQEAQGELIPLLKAGASTVVEGAAFGIIHSVESGAASTKVVTNIRDLVKKRGVRRQIGAKALAHLAGTKPRLAVPILTSIISTSDDLSLPPIGMHGLCDAFHAGYEKAGTAMIKTAKRALSTNVRRIAIRCIADFPTNGSIAARLAMSLATDSDNEIRLECARVLAQLAQKATYRRQAEKTLVKLTQDSNRDVRIVVLEALAKFGTIPEHTLQNLPAMFAQRDDKEKLSILRIAANAGSTELIPLAISDRNPELRIAAMNIAIDTNTNANEVLRMALTDQESAVRLAALQRLSAANHSLPTHDIDEALTFATRDLDLDISRLAMQTIAKRGSQERALSLLTDATRSRSETVRTNAAMACANLTSRAPNDTITLLEPLLRDPSHDVRAASLGPLATAYATVLSQEELRDLLMSSEALANRRLVATGALWVRATMSEEEHLHSSNTLKSVATNGSPFTKRSATLALRLLHSSSDGLLFLQSLVP